MAIFSITSETSKQKGPKAKFVTVFIILLGWAKAN